MFAFFSRRFRPRLYIVSAEGASENFRVFAGAQHMTSYCSNSREGGKCSLAPPLRAPMTVLLSESSDRAITQFTLWRSNQGFINMVDKPKCLEMSCWTLGTLITATVVTSALVISYWIDRDDGTCDSSSCDHTIRTINPRFFMYSQQNRLCLLLFCHNYVAL